MSCTKCEEAQEKSAPAYFRIGHKKIGFASIGVNGCDAHVGLVFLAMMEYLKKPSNSYRQYHGPIQRLAKPPQTVSQVKTVFNIIVHPDTE